MINYLTVTSARFTQRVENISFMKRNNSSKSVTLYHHRWYVCLDMSNIKVSPLLSGLVLIYVTITGK